jgi:D-threo-aldose 1-dehydrogenase
VDIVMLGARKVAEWADAVAMMQHPISQAFWADLRAHRLLPVGAPTPCP